MADTPRPKVGDFTSKTDNAPRPAPATNNPPTTPPVASAPAPQPKPEPQGFPDDDLTDEEKRILADKKQAEDDAKLTPAERYRKRLMLAGIDLSVATGIYDAVLEKDYYEEYIPVRNTTKAVFRTRRYADALRLQTMIEKDRPGLIMTQEDIITRYNLAASLYEWKGRSIAHANEDDFKKVLELLNSMPTPIYSLLGQALAKFDWKIAMVFSEGATENFS